MTNLTENYCAIARGGNISKDPVLLKNGDIANAIHHDNGGFFTSMEVSFVNNNGFEEVYGDILTLESLRRDVERVPGCRVDLMKEAINIYNEYASDTGIGQMNIGISERDPEYVSYAGNDLRTILGNSDLPSDVHDAINDRLERSGELSDDFYNIKARISTIESAAVDVGLNLSVTPDPKLNNVNTFVQNH